MTEQPGRDIDGDLELCRFALEHADSPRNLLALADAMGICYEHQIPPPQWLFDQVAQLVDGVIEFENARNGE